MSIAESYVTPEQYLAIERAAAGKSEYHAGRMFLMAGATEAHVLITTNLGMTLGMQLRERPCRTYTTDLRLKVSEAGLYTYPDVMVVCGTPSFEDERRDTLLNPTLIVEVLSPSTETYDRGNKFEFYSRLESLREYLLVSQDRCCVDHFIRESKEDPWQHQELDGAETILELSSIGCQIPLSEIYLKVDLPAPASR